MSQIFQRLKYPSAVFKGELRRHGLAWPADRNAADFRNYCGVGLRRVEAAFK